ncbi:MAG: glycerophosphodiester phosphodiesterase [Anaerolineae bacterium]
MIEQQSDVATLLAAPQDESDRALAARYAPLICFDAREPFLPLAVGYTIFREDADSPSFPRRVELSPAGEPVAAFAIEYAIWWDWDITHLYELEHIWVFVGNDGRLVRGEASWHGRYYSMAVDGKLSVEGERLVVFSEPGKHAFAPSPDRFTRPDQQRRTRLQTTRWAGAEGVWVAPPFEGKIAFCAPYVNRLVHTYLERRAFEPAWEFSQRFVVGEELLVPWPALQAWIPDRVAWWVSELTRTIPPQELRFLRIAHRGASAHAPENTLAAFRLAAELGADMVELDVRVSADSVPVVIHDPSVARTTNGTGLVADLTLAELKRLDAGRGERIPTLEEAMEACREAGVGLYIEVKDGRAVLPLVELVHRHRLKHSVIVNSFRPDWLAYVKALAPHIPTSVLFNAVNVDPVKLAQGVRAEYVHPCWEWYAPQPHQLLSPEWIRRVREANLGIIVWHEERPEEIAVLRHLGVDGICSDRPDLLSGV